MKHFIKGCSKVLPPPPPLLKSLNWEIVSFQIHHLFQLQFLGHMQESLDEFCALWQNQSHRHVFNSCSYSQCTENTFFFCIWEIIVQFNERCLKWLFKNILSKWCSFHKDWSLRKANNWDCISQCLVKSILQTTSNSEELFCSIIVNYGNYHNIVSVVVTVVNS